MRQLLDFFAIARSCGVAISTAESIVAVGAVALVGYDDRRALKDALGLVLAKTADERERFEACFEPYFRLGSLTLPAVDANLGDDAAIATPSVLAAVAQSRLASTLLGDDRAALIHDLYAAAARADLTALRLFTQTGLFSRRILAELGIEALDAAIAQLRRADDAAQTRAARFLAGRRQAVVELARDLVERRLAARGRGDAQRLHDRFLREARLAHLDRADLERMRTLVATLARRLVTRYGRFHARPRRGRLDVHRTLRGNAAFEGQFLLLFMSTLADYVADVRSFAFCDSLLDVTAIVAQEPIETAIATIMRAIGFRSSDYGRALDEFEREHLALVDRKTTVVILGDGRTNYGNPRVDVVRTLHDRAKRVIWLNPENRVAWGTDDSEMLHYLPYCSVARECNRLRHLEDVVENLLR